MIHEVIGNGHIEFVDDVMVLNLEKEPYVPILVYKALIFMAMSIIPEEELDALHNLRILI